MVRKITALALVTLMILSACTAALAETKTYEFAIKPVSDPQNFTSGAPAIKKNDGDTYFYVTETECGFSDGRKVYYRSITSSREIASNYLSFTSATGTTKKAKYYDDMAIGGNTFYLGIATQLKTNDPYAGIYVRVSGRWTP